MPGAACGGDRHAASSRHARPPGPPSASYPLGGGQWRDTDLFLIFDGPGQDARLAWILCFYDGDRGAPRLADFLLRHDALEILGYPALQRAGWRLFTDGGGGVGAVVERDGDHPRMVALIMGRPERMTALVRRLRPPMSGDESTVGDAAQDPLRARIGRIDVDVQVAPEVGVDRVELQRELQVAANEKVGDWPVLLVAPGSKGRLAVDLGVEAGAPGDHVGIRLTTQATLDAEGAGGEVHAQSDRYQRDLATDSSQDRLEAEARQLMERGIDAVGGSAQIQHCPTGPPAASTRRRYPPNIPRDTFSPRSSTVMLRHVARVPPVERGPQASQLGPEHTGGVQGSELLFLIREARLPAAFAGCFPGNSAPGALPIECGC
jgi:hypothetical protein